MVAFRSGNREQEQIPRPEAGALGIAEVHGLLEGAEGYRAARAPGERHQGVRPVSAEGQGAQVRALRGEEGEEALLASPGDEQELAPAEVQRLARSGCSRRGARCPRHPAPCR
jgi:hypothetical protein